VRRTQLGNNNGYCLDNATNWFDWTLLDKHADVNRFVRLLIARRLMRDVEHEHLTLVRWLQDAIKAWHGVKLYQPDWSPWSHSLALNVKAADGLAFHLIFNAYWEPLAFELPPLAEGVDAWHRWIDTSLNSPDDIVDWRTSPPVSGKMYRVGERSVVVLINATGTLRLL
jgi:glycogen operon protein